MKTYENPSPHASRRLVAEARRLGLPAEVIPRAKPGHRRGAQKVVLINGMRMSIGQAREYLLGPVAVAAQSRKHRQSQQALKRAAIWIAQQLVLAILPAALILFVLYDFFLQ